MGEGDDVNTTGRKLVVEIEWDLPNEQGWLCPDNIRLALAAYCPNTRFKVRGVSDG